MDLTRSDQNLFFQKRRGKEKNIVSAQGIRNAERPPSSSGLTIDEIVALSSNDVIFADKYKMVSLPSSFYYIIIDGALMRHCHPPFLQQTGSSP